MHATIIMSIGTTLVDDVVIDSKVSATPPAPQLLHVSHRDGVCSQDCNEPQLSSGLDKSA